LLESWSLPESLTESVRYQHLADYDGEFAMHVRLLRFARQVLDAVDLVDVSDTERSPLRAEELGIRQDRLESTIERLRASSQMLDGAASFLPG
jgi:HD-like signal output (HDOD) protein